MADLFNKYAIEIRTRSTNSGEGRGSAFPVGKGLIMTCAHVVRGKAEVWVRWCEYPDEDLPDDLELRTYEVAAETGGSSDQRFTKAEVVFCGGDDDPDIALLTAFHPPDFGFFPISPLGGEVDERVGGIGFPRATANNLFRSVAMNGTVAQAASRDNGGQTQIHLDQRAHEPTDWRGASGAPVVLKDNMTVIGVYRITEHHLADANTIWAVSAPMILAHEELSRHLEDAACTPEAMASARQSHLLAMRDKIEIVLERLEPRPLKRLARKLGVDEDSADPIEDCALRLSDAAADCLGSLSETWRDYEGSPAQAVFRELIELTTVCEIAHDGPRVLVIGKQRELPADLAPGNPTSMEVIAAQIDGRPPAYPEHRRSASDMPAGRTALNMEAAEAGPGADADVPAIEKDLFLRGGFRMRSDPRKVEAYMAREPLLTGARRDPLTDEDRRELAGVFRRSRLVSGEASHYTAHCLHLDPAEQDKADRIADYFRKTYPGVMIIPLDPTRWDRDGDRFATVLSAIPVKPA